MSTQDQAGPRHANPAHKVGLATCVALVVANMVGTGVFTSLGFQLQGVPSRPAIMLLWALGGAISLCGALCYAELSAALPRSGGEYNFLGRTYHPALGFMAGVVSLVAGFAAPIALSSLAFGDYLHGALPGVPAKGAACAAIVVVALFHSRSLRVGSVFQILFTAGKILLVIGLSLALFGAEAAPATPAPAPWTSYVLGGPFAVSLLFCLYAYSGWNGAVYIFEEVQVPAKTIPLALTAGTVAVTGLYLALNAAFLHAAPADALMGKVEVAQAATAAAFGVGGGRAVAGIIALGLVSAISAMTWAGPRVAMVLGQDYPRSFGFLARRGSDGIPSIAVAVQAAIALAFVAGGGFKQILVYTQFALTACTFLAVLGAIVLRVREPGLARPFRMPLYPVPAITFLAATGLTLAYSAAAQPLQAAWGTATLLAGALLYGFASRLEKSPRR